MSSPKSEKICNGSKDIPRNTCFSSESSGAQGSLSSGDINNLSPVQPLKDAAILQGIPGITSPPNRFTSPRFKPQSSILNRQQQCHTSSAEYPQATVGLDKTHAILDDQGRNISPVDEEFLDTGSREHLDATSKLLGSAAVKKDSIKDNCLGSGISRLLFKRADESSVGGIVSNVCQMEDESHQFVARSEVCSDVISKAFTEQDCKESLHEVNHGQAGVLRQSFDFGEHHLKSVRDDTSVRQMDVSVASKPRGIGLHLNSIVAGQQGNLVIGKQSSKGMVKLQRKSLIISRSTDTHTISSNTFEKISPISKADLDLNEPVDMATPNEYLLTGTAKSPDFPVPLSPALEELAESSGESNQAGSKTKTKQASNFDGCKRCSCKKSKCLKLYCDCFAAGLYCVDSCSCQGCFNRPEHKESVIEARQLIESRNPLAFAPRVMQHVANSPTNSGESSEPVAQTPLRHKRGCNCRKSMCLKKYCECYEANVGCSDACRCEGCKNVNGKKPDYDARIHTPQNRTSEEALDQKHKLLITRRNHFSIDEGKDFSVAVPCTPAIVCSDSLRKNEMKSLRPGRRYVLSPDPNLDTPPSAKHQSSSSSSSRSSMFNLCHFTRLTNPNPNPNPNPPMEEPLPKYLTSNVCIENHEAMHNDTPMILRHSSAPVKSVKVGSPNNKRVSPPHNHHLDELRVRSSRKFIFRSVPELPPPLSPCCDSNNPTDNLADAY